MDARLDEYEEIFGPLPYGPQVEAHVHEYNNYWAQEAARENYEEYLHFEGTREEIEEYYAEDTYPLHPLVRAWLFERTKNEG